MSQSDTNKSNATSGDTAAEALEIIREEQRSRTVSSRMTASQVTSEVLKNDLITCICNKYDEGVKEQKVNADELERLLNEKETALRAEYDKILDKEKALLKERFEFILANEQTRASHLLREAHRERQEKITVLQSQLQCKNLAALMYVMCTEKRRSKLEKLRIIRDYTEYIHSLQDILTEGQELILHLSKGYKTAARVEHEWREKMKRVVSEFLAFIYHFAGGNPETNQYLIDLPKLLKTEAPIEDNPNENPCDDEEEEENREPLQEIPQKKKWFERLDEARRPFVVFGDMSEFNPAERRDVIKSIKGAKSAPKKWRSYVFNDMFFNASCPHVDDIKDLYLTKLPTPTKWECENSMSMAVAPTLDLKEAHAKNASKQSLNASFRMRPSMDIRGNMGSLLRIITSGNTAPVPAKTELLGARDSMEITSTTKVRERAQSMRPVVPEENPEPLPVLAIGKKRASIFEGGHTEIHDEEAPNKSKEPSKEIPKAESEADKETVEDTISVLGSVHNDSLLVIPGHVPDVDHKINYERVCPMEKCQLLQVDSFTRSLPPYMRANPFTHFEQTFERYETCTPEQLEMLKQRIEAKKKKEDEENRIGTESPMQEWLGRGVAVQTSNLSMSLPPCTCHAPSPTPVSSNLVFDFQDLLPVKQAMDAIHKELMFDNRVEFERFKLVGQDSVERLSEESKKEFQQVRHDEIKKILNQHPSLLDIFQANTR